MATLTFIDIQNSNWYSEHLYRLRFIPKWRTKMPHILINYEIRAANNNDYYVPPTLAHKAIHVKLKFSKRGCESMTCYPFHETGPIDANTPTGYTQTSETAIIYGQPACYNLDRVAATREGGENEVQAPELRYTQGEQCLLVDTVSKMYFNSPYMRTDEHLVKGIDDVPAFNVQPASDLLFPERFVGTFNEAYCRRFGRDLVNGGCHVAWWESLIGFVLGDTIYITLKMLANNVFSELRNFNYKRPSPLLPPPPTVDSDRLLNDWRNVRDPKVDVDFEIAFNDYQTMTDLTLTEAFNKLVYRAEEGFFREHVPRALKYRTATTLASTSFSNNNNDDDLETIISQFLEDNALILGIATSVGFDYLFDAIKAILKRINTTLIPLLKQTLLNTSRQVTTRLLGETYKAAVTQAFNRMAIKTISTIAKAMTRIAIKAASIIGIILIIVSIGDLILGLWDPFGYNNMFPPEYPEDLSISFLTSYFASLNNGTRDLVEFLPEHFEELVEAEEDNILTIDAITDLLEYIASLTVNSNGQMLEFDNSETITDFDEATLVGSALASSALYTHLDFLQYTQRHNDILYRQQTTIVVPVLFIAGAAVLAMLPHRDTNATALFIIFLMLALYTLLVDALSYYVNLRRHTSHLNDRWYDNLYSE
ncbi:per os infectivity factor 0 [Alphabaculovirus altersperidaniae]|uniref:Per os infectivity factor 0 n=1 Tax=Spodoptera eridania nucleopolyhedrovirus TaxID=2315721 RepID=A0ABX6TS46_9ABAC|nr:per os infectivity factor 0 [Spodoptera eridania nucleopolyhedrovirus]QNV47909.1 per os infectivity factor 0 [Spodoptera eridania nucleopolyhedrovirus]